MTKVAFQIPLRNYAPLTIVDGTDDGRCHLEELRTMMGGEVLTDFRLDNGYDSIAVLPNGNLSENLLDIGLENICWEGRGKTFQMGVSEEFARKQRFLIWRRLFVAACTARTLRGEYILPLHGAILKRSDHQAILICGQSGMGKSTTATRWNAAGKECPADDLMILECGQGVFHVHPMPTWSRAEETFGAEFFPANEAIPVMTFLALDRGHNHEECRLTDDYRYMMSIYSACGFFEFLFLKSSQAEALRAPIAQAVQAMAQRIYDIFPHKAIFAVLDDQDIGVTLKEYLP